MHAGFDYIGVTTPFFCTDGHGRFLLHKRSARCRDEQGTWDVGAGQLEFGQSFEESVLREVREEYGCDGTILEQLPVKNILRHHDGKQTHWVSIAFVIKVDPTTVRNNEPDKIDELGWFTLDNLPHPLHSGTGATLQWLADRFARYGHD